MEQQVSQRSIKKYMVLFPVLALLVCFVILKGADMESVWNAMKSAKPQWMAAGLILAAVFNIAEAINLRSVLNSFGYQVSFRQGMKYAYTGYFFSSITPSATGGQPVQLYVMNKDNIHVAHGTMALLTELTSFQIAAFLMENVATFWILTGRIRLNKMIMKLPFGNKKRLGAKMDEIVRDFEDCKLFFKRDPVLALKVTTVSLIQIICWFSVPWAVYHAMGESGSSYGSMFLHQIILYMTTALLPFPGAEGISEFSFVKLFAGIFTGESGDQLLFIADIKWNL